MNDAEDIFDRMVDVVLRAIDKFGVPRYGIPPKAERTTPSPTPAPAPTPGQRAAVTT